MLGLFLNLTGIVGELGLTLFGVTAVLGATLSSILGGLTGGL
ncbi:MAG TPA: hypothetical protein VHV82_19575 [Sporichthyaceae bacterium]|jgi:hypothetical protein|nr:hypothetical protein [Sporichthyaceae bacterium]